MLKHKLLSMEDCVSYDFQRMAKIGWWEANFSMNLFAYSEYITEILELSSNIMPFEDFIHLVHEDHRKRIGLKFFILQQFDTYDEIFPIQTPDGDLWIHAKFGYKKTNPEGHHIVRGYVQYLSEYRKQDIYTNAPQLQLNDLLGKYNSLSQSLLKFLKDENTDKVIKDTLKDILCQFEADRIHIFEYDKERGDQSCIYEVTGKDIRPEIHTLQNLPISSNPWFSKHMQNNWPIIINDLAHCTNIPDSEKNALIRQNISALMVISLNSKEGIWGYMGIDMVGRPKQWNHTEYEWFASLSNIVSICIKLRQSELKAQKKQEHLIKANEMISRNEEKLQNIYKSIPVGIEFYGRDGQLEYVNERLLEILELSDENVRLGTNLFQNPYLPEKIKYELKQGRDVSFEMDYNSSAGERSTNRNEELKKLNIKSAILRNQEGNVENYMLIIIDNTDRQSAYKKIKEFEGFFTYIAEFAEIGLYQWNPITRTGFAMDQWFKNMNEEGRTLQDVVGNYNTLHPDDAQKIRNFYDQVVKGAATELRAELRIQNGGRWKWIRTNLKVKEYDPANKNIKVIGVNIDLSELKQTEAKLIKAKIKAEEADRLKSAFLANMSHEIRTPLNAIVGFSSILAESEDPSERQQYVSIIQKNNELLLQLISDILDLSKIESGAYEMSSSNIDTNKLCTEILQPFQNKLQPEVELVTDGELPHYMFHSDRNQLTQVLSNFITNAIKFTSQGSIKLGCKLINQQLEFYVSDTGIGVDPKKRGRIFDRFVKLNTFINGTGLGLSICKNIIENMGGQIGVESIPGEGSYFWFRIPFNPPKKEQMKEEKCLSSVPEKEPGGILEKKTILIAEDTDSNFLLLAAILKNQYQILRAHGGIEALHMTKTYAPQLILMDIKMPQMDGLTATKLIRTGNKQIPIIALTAFAFESDRQKFFAAGCNDYLVKPINADLLKTTLHKYLTPQSDK